MAAAMAIRAMPCSSVPALISTERDMMEPMSLEMDEALRLNSASDEEWLLFGPFRVSPAQRALLRGDEPILIGSRALDLLIALLERRGEVVDKRELMQRVWSGMTVEDGSLRWHLSVLRKALGDGDDGARYIANQFGRGYSFVAPVRRERRNEVILAPLDIAMPAANPVYELPPLLPRMIGREDDLQNLIRLLMRSRFTTVLGGAGIGKTTVAVSAAHRMAAQFDGRTLFIDLSSISDPALVPTLVASAFNLNIPTEDPTPAIISFLAEQRLLLVLDNCEHVIDGASRLAEQLYWDAPKVHILATSREALNVEGEYILRLEGLRYSESPLDETVQALLDYPAVELFMDRLMSRGDVAATTEADIVIIAEMCRKLDGSALGIELAASRVPTYGLHQTADLLGKQFSLSWQGRRTARPRQQTLQATLDWSFALLSKDEQTALCWLSIFVGHFTLAAAMMVLVDETHCSEQVHASLQGLAAKSLLSSDHSRGATEYRLLELTRAYADARLHSSGDYRRCAARHAAYVLSEIQARYAGLSEAAEPKSLERIVGNVRAALEWSLGSSGDVEIGVSLAASASPYLLEQSLLTECRTWCERGIAALHGNSSPPSLEMELQAGLGLSTMFTHGNTEVARLALNRALDLAQIIDSPVDQLRIMGRLQIFHERIGEYHESLAWAERAAGIAAIIGNDDAMSVAYSLLGISHHLMGNQQQAAELFQNSLQISPPSLKLRTVHWGFDHRNRSGIGLARARWLLGEPDRALTISETMIREAASLQHPVTHCIALIWAVSVHTWRGEYEDAARQIDIFSELAEFHGLGPYRMLAKGFRGELMVRSGDIESGLALIEETLTRLHQVRYELVTTSFMLTVVDGLMQLGRFQEAQERVEACITNSCRNGDMFTLAELLRLKGRALNQMAGATAAEPIFIESIRLSQSQSALSWELRGARDLAQLWLDQGRASEAYALLAPVRARFKEGSTTKDLRDVDAFLAQLELIT